MRSTCRNRPEGEASERRLEKRKKEMEEKRENKRGRKEVTENNLKVNLNKREPGVLKQM